MNRGFDLFSVPVEGGEPTLLSFAQQQDYRGAEGYAISPNGDWVAFVQQVSPEDPSEALFVVPIAGGTPLQLSTPQPIVSDLVQSDIYEHALQFSPDGRYILYRQNDVFDVMGGSATLRTAVYAVALPAQVPEPSAGLLLAVGAALIGLTRWRRAT